MGPVGLSSLMLSTWVSRLDSHSHWVAIFRKSPGSKPPIRGKLNTVHFASLSQPYPFGSLSLLNSSRVRFRFGFARNLFVFIFFTIFCAARPHVDTFFFFLCVCVCFVFFWIPTRGRCRKEAKRTLTRSNFESPHSMCTRSWRDVQLKARIILRP